MPDGVWSLAFSPDGQQLATGNWDKSIRIWQVGEWNELGIFIRHTSTVMTIAYSPDSKYIASGSKDNTIKIWDARFKKAPTPSKNGQHG